MLRRRTDGDDLESFYDVDDDEGSPRSLAVWARRMAKVGIGVAAASCVVVLGLRISDVGAGTGQDLPASAVNDRPSGAAPTADTQRRTAVEVASPPVTASAEPVGVPAAAEAPTTSVIAADGSGPSPERTVPGSTAAGSRRATASAPITGAVPGPPTPSGAPSPASIPARTPATTAPVGALPSPASPHPTPVAAPASSSASPTAPASQGGPPATVPPVAPSVTTPPVTPSPAPAPSVPAVPEQAAHWWEPGPPGNSGDHRHDDDRGRPDSPGQSEQHVGADDDDGGLADPGSPDDEG